MTVETKIDKTLNKIFGYIDWFKEYEAAPDDTHRRSLLLQHNDEIAMLLLDTKSKCEVYFENVVDQPIYMTEDYLRLRKFLVHWYAAYNTAIREEQNVSNISFIDKGMLLQSLGYSLHSLHNETHRTTLCTSLSDMYSKKGTPLVIAQAMSLLDISNFAIFEYWLEREGGTGELQFSPEQIEDMSYNTGFVLETKPVKPYSGVVEADPHWYMTEEEIMEAEATEEVGLPSLTPYVGIISTNDWVRDSRLVMSWVNRQVYDQADKFYNDPNYDLDTDRKYYFQMVSSDVSLLELFLAIGYVYNIHFERDSDLFVRDGITERVPCFNGDEYKLFTEIQFIGEHNQVYKRTFDRDERDELLRKSKEEWQTLNPMTTWTHNESAVVLNDVNPELKALCDNMLAGEQGYDFLISLMGVFDFYIKFDLGLSNYTSKFMLYDPLQENREALNKVFDFFKPYQTRLIEAVSYLVFKDLPGDCVAINDELFMRIFHRTYEYYNNLYDHLKDRVRDRYFDVAGRVECPTIFCDMLNMIITHQEWELDYDIEDKIVRTNVRELIVEWYNLWYIKMNYVLKTYFGDRVSFNKQPNEWPIQSAYVFAHDLYKFFEKTFDRVTSSDFLDTVYDRYRMIDHLIKGDSLDFEGSLDNLKSVLDVKDGEYDNSNLAKLVFAFITNFETNYIIGGHLTNHLDKIVYDYQDDPKTAPVEIPKDRFMMNSLPDKNQTPWYSAVMFDRATISYIEKRAYELLNGPLINPSLLVRDVSISGDGEFAVASYRYDPHLLTYKYDHVNEEYVKLNDPIVSAGDMFWSSAISLSDDGSIMAVDGYSEILTYKFDIATQTYLRLAGPNIASGFTNELDLSGDGNFLVAAIGGTPSLVTYKFDNTSQSFIKLADPDILPPGTGAKITLSDNGFLVIATTTAPYLYIYKYDQITDKYIQQVGVDHTYTNYPNISISNDGKYLATIYPSLLVIFKYDEMQSKYLKYDEIPTGVQIRDLSFSADGKYLVMCSTYFPRLYVFERGATGYKEITNSATSTDGLYKIDITNDGSKFIVGRVTNGVATYKVIS